MTIQQMFLGAGGPLTYTAGTSWTGDLGAQDGTTVDLIFNNNTSTGLFGKGNSTYPFTYWFTNLPIINSKLRLFFRPQGPPNSDYLVAHTSNGATSAGYGNSAWQNFSSYTLNNSYLTKIVLHGQSMLCGIEIDDVVLIDT